MGILSLGGTKRAEPKKKTEPIKQCSDDWYQVYCKKCPYLVHDEIMKMLHCVRSAGKDCLAQSILVAGSIMVEAHNARMKKSCRDNNGPTRIKTPDPIVNELAKKRRAKIIKRKR